MRTPDWQKRFWKVINLHLESRFEWGVFDCVTFAAECREALTGRNEIKERFGEWSTAFQASLATRRHAAGLDKSTALLLGKCVTPSQLSMGDVGLAIDDANRKVLVVHDGAGFICPGPVGYQRMPFQNVKFGWRI